MLTNAPRGTADLFGDEVFYLRHVEKILKEISEKFYLHEIVTPTFEHTELFIRGVGDNTDIVNKEMYTFKDRGDRSITLKPEGTAPTARAFIEHKLYNSLQPLKLYYINNTFRYERPQEGRMREFRQYGIEIFGSQFPECDAEVISIGHEILKKLGIKNIDLKINSLGDKISRLKYSENLKKYIDENKTYFCETCIERNKKNTLRVLDCKNKKCQEIIKKAPSILDFLSEKSKDHFEKVKDILNTIGIKFKVDNKIVRGLDYYTGVVFEFNSSFIGSQNTICGGGRYDDLIKEFGGPQTSAVGFGMGIERVIMTLKKQNIDFTKYKKYPDIYIGQAGENSILKSQELLFNLRTKGILAEGDTLRRSVKAQLKYANKIKAKYALIIGEEEIEKGICKVKNMSNGEFINVKIDNLYEKLFTTN